MCAVVWCPHSTKLFGFLDLLLEAVALLISNRLCGDVVWGGCFSCPTTGVPTKQETRGADARRPGQESMRPALCHQHSRAIVVASGQNSRVSDIGSS